MTPQTVDALARVSRYFHDLSATRHALLRSPPFSLLIDRTSKDRYRNYAVPDDAAAPDAASVRALVRLFDDRDRVPRLEYIPALAPAVEDALLAAGFKPEGELPLMSCTTATLRPEGWTSQAKCRLVHSSDELRRAAQVQNSAYGAGAATDADTDRLRRLLDDRGLLAVAVGTDGDVLGSGLVSAPIDGVAEIAAIGVLEGARRKGVGSAISAFLASQALSAGIDLPFLMAAGEAEARMYRRVGFVAFGTMLHISLRDGR